MRDKITVSFSDVLNATNQSHIELINALKEEIRSSNQSAEANDTMGMIILLAGLEHLKLTNQLTPTSTPNEVCSHLMKLIHGAGPEWNMWLNSSEFLPTLKEIAKNGMPTKETGRQFLEGLLLQVAEKKGAEDEDIVSMNLNEIFKNSNLAKIMNYVKVNSSEERISAVRRFETPISTIDRLNISGTGQATQAAATSSDSHPTEPRRPGFK